MICLHSCVYICRVWQILCFTTYWQYAQLLRDVPHILDYNHSSCKESYLLVQQVNILNNIITRSVCNIVKLSIKNLGSLPGCRRAFLRFLIKTAIQSLIIIPL